MLKEDEDNQMVLEEIIRNLGYIQCSPSSIICKQGQPGNLFYIIFSGQVSVYIENADKKTNYL